jgi:Spy/CpxP family protein refolding chaperone
MNMIRKTILSLVGATLVVAAAPKSLTAQQPPPPDAQERPRVQDPVRQLNLSPEQRERIRAIRQELQAERAVINERLRETNKALDDALDADNPDEGLIEQRLRDFATAQAAANRMRVLSEVRIRRVLTPEQLAMLRDLRQKAQLLRRERQRDNLETRRQERVDRQQNQSNRRNGLGPLFRRRAVPQKTLP